MARPRLAGGTCCAGTPSISTSPSRDFFQPRDHSQQRGLAAAGGPHEGNELVVVDEQIDAMYHLWAPNLLRTFFNSTVAIIRSLLLLDRPERQTAHQLALADPPKDQDGRGRQRRSRRQLRPEQALRAGRRRR